MLCKNCTDELGKCYIFLKKIKKADEQLQQMMVSTETEDQEDRMNDEKSTVTIENNDNENYKKVHDNDVVNQHYEYHSCEDGENYVIEYLNEEDLKEDENEQEKDEKTKKKGKKRKINNNKTPNIIITDNVSNILSKIQKTNSDSKETSIKLSDVVNSKKNINNSQSKQQSSLEIEPITDKDSFVITKFILNEDEFEIDSNNTDNHSSSTVNQIRTIDLAPVKINAVSEIKTNDNDDDNEDIYIEDPNTIYKCKYCPRAFSMSYYLIKHTRKAHCCQFCTKGFEKTDDLYHHIKTDHSHFKCTLCEKEFTSNGNLRQHLKKIHNVILPAHTSILSFIKKE